MGECYRFLADEEELRWFWTYCVPRLNPRECYFMSCSARNKKLSEEEREYYRVGRSEMWAKQIVAEDDYSRFLKGIRRCEANRLAYLTKGGMPYPDKVLVLYFNVVPTDAYWAMKLQIEYLLDLQMQLTDSALKGSEKALEETWRNVRHSHTTGQSVFARSYGEDTWLDIDMDCKNWIKSVDGWRSLDEIKTTMTADLGLGNYAQIWTAGGWHWLIRMTALRDMGRKIKADPVKRLIQTMEDGLVKYGFKPDEIVSNKNKMIPLPGTLQYGDHLVQVMNKDDFTEDMRLHDWPEVTSDQTVSGR
jgi:hypothetical protein